MNHVSVQKLGPSLFRFIAFSRHPNGTWTVCDVIECRRKKDGKRWMRAGGFSGRFSKFGPEGVL